MEPDGAASNRLLTGLAKSRLLGPSKINVDQINHEDFFFSFPWVGWVGGACEILKSPALVVLGHIKKRKPTDGRRN